jgi:hypothetical protein
MAQKDYLKVIDLYMKACLPFLAIQSTLPTAPPHIPFSKNHTSVIADGEATDPKYMKAWSTLDHTQFALGDAKGSPEAYSFGSQ